MSCDRHDNASFCINGSHVQQSLADYRTAACSAKLELVYVLIGAKLLFLTLSPFKLFTCTCIVCMDGGYSQGRGEHLPPLNEILLWQFEVYIIVGDHFTFSLSLIPQGKADALWGQRLNEPVSALLL